MTENPNNASTPPTHLDVFLLISNLKSNISNLSQVKKNILAWENCQHLVFYILIGRALSYSYAKLISLKRFRFLLVFLCAILAYSRYFRSLVGVVTLFNLVLSFTFGRDLAVTYGRTGVDRNDLLRYLIFLPTVVALISCIEWRPTDEMGDVVICTVLLWLVGKWSYKTQPRIALRTGLILPLASSAMIVWFCAVVILKKTKIFFQKT